ncbi:MAG: RNA methyltransferase [Desulfatiglandaceae bacterium]
MRLYMGLVHFPVYNKDCRRIASAVTTMDLHDLARLARTYGVKQLFIVTPLEDQKALVQRVLTHWQEGYGARYNPDRKEALQRVCVSTSLERAIGDVSAWEGVAPVVVGTDASAAGEHMLSYGEARHMIRENRAVMLIFGTAWGLHLDLINAMDHVLMPIAGVNGYNHLSVRTAAAIILDRLVGDTPQAVS